MRMVRTLTIIIALVVVASLTGCSGSGGSVSASKLLSFSGTYTSTFVHAGTNGQGSISSTATMTIQSNGNMNGTITAFPNSGDTSTFNGTTTINSNLTSGTTNFTMNTTGTDNVTSTGTIVFSYANGVFSGTLTDSLLPSAYSFSGSGS